MVPPPALRQSNMGTPSSSMPPCDHQSRKPCIPPATSPLLRLLFLFGLSPTAACDNVLGRQHLNCSTCNTELALSSRELLDC